MLTLRICPVCKVVVDAQVNIRGGKVCLRKRCWEHGRFEALVYGDGQAYTSSGRFDKPGTIPLTFQTEVRDVCPSDCGLCPEHKQHACPGIIEVNTNCNLDCPICFADSGQQPPPPLPDPARLHWLRRRSDHHTSVTSTASPPSRNHHA